jgi:ATP-independent RNA helicase DbpA
MQENFSSLPISESQITTLDALGYSKMTPVQAACLPHVLNGKDVIAQAKTGSGKTAAFGIGLLALINPRFFAVQAMVLCPTRELAEQVARELRRLAQGVQNIKLVSLVGGKPLGPQRNSLEHGAHIVVGTPGRVLDLLKRKHLKLTDLKALVLDEADRMLDMGFADDMKEVVRQTPKDRQTLLFSATFPEEIKKTSRSFQRNPVNVKVEAEHKAGVIKQIFYQVKKHERNNTLLALFEHYEPESALVFCHTKKQCDEVARFLDEHRIQSKAIHGDLEQRERDQVLIQFSNGSCPVLVGTDVAARGLDIKSLQMVVNYELPRDPEIYVHRIGRTGRAGEKGLAMSIFTEAEQVRINAIEKQADRPCVCDVFASLDRQPGFKLIANKVTIQIDAGRRQKIRPGDILGALTGDAGLEGSQIGKIDILEMSSYVALELPALRQALNYLADGKIKARKVKARRVR